MGNNETIKITFLSSGPQGTPLTEPMLQQLPEVTAVSYSCSFSAAEENGGGD